MADGKPHFEIIDAVMTVTDGKSHMDGRCYGQQWQMELPHFIGWCYDHVADGLSATDGKSCMNGRCYGQQWQMELPHFIGWCYDHVAALHNRTHSQSFAWS